SNPIRTSHPRNVTRMLPVRLLAALCIRVPLEAAPAQTVDLLLRGGAVVDRTGAAPRTADVGIRGERIVFVGDATRERIVASRVIDVRWLIVAPGFIDPH